LRPLRKFLLRTLLKALDAIARRLLDAEAQETDPWLRDALAELGLRDDVLDADLEAIERLWKSRGMETC
jgi:hypothetical protein